MKTETAKNNSPTPVLSQSAVREVLQYVPIFSGKTFLVALNGGSMADTVMAEVLLDLIALQRIGVKLILFYAGERASDLLDRAAEVELKLSDAEEDVISVLNRGQASLVTTRGELAFNEQLVRLSARGRVDKILFLGSVRHYPPEWVGALTTAEVSSSLHSPSSPDALSHWILEAIAQGVSRVHLLDGAMPGCLSRELFSNEGVGIMVYAGTYLNICSLAEEDIPELLAIIGRSMRAQHLLPRTYKELVEHISDYYVMKIDGNVVGSVAVYDHGGGVCELACLFVKGAHKGLGYGHDLVRFAEQVASEKGFKVIIALSTDAGGFFENVMGYKRIPLEELPKKRLDKQVASGRKSIALRKVIL